MLTITVPESDLWDEQNEVFISVKEQTLRLEHSLVSISKWESKWCKSFLNTENKTEEETIDYIKCMTLTQNVDPNVYKALTVKNLSEINEYIKAPMTATTVKEKKGVGGREIVTSELIYYWMIELNIPSEYQKWHINRLLMLIKVCNAKSDTPKKMSNKELMSRNAALNAARRKQLNTKG